MNNNYAFWDIDPTDWDAVYDEYMPKFKALGTLRDLTDDDVTLINGYFEEMLENIVDGHFRVEYTFRDKFRRMRPTLLRYAKRYGDDWQTSEIMKEGSVSYVNNDLEESYLNEDFIEAAENSLDNFHLFTRMIEETRFNVATGYKTESIGGVDKDILYFHFSGFSWGDLFPNFYSVFPTGSDDPKYKAIDNALAAYGGGAQTVREVIDYTGYTINDDGTADFIDDDTNDLKKLITCLNNSGITPPADNWFTAIYTRAAMDHFYYFFDQLAAKKNDGRDVCGAIIDLRGNRGGLAQDLSTLWGRIVPADFVFAKNKFKAGENRLDYTPPMDFTIFKHPENDYGGVTTIPIVLVVNKFSISCSEITTLFFRELPNGHIVGGTTWGGMGALSPGDNKLINAGQFAVGKPAERGIIELVYTSGLQTMTLDDKIFEGKGIPPDYEVPFNYTNMMAGTDDRLQKAIAVVLEKQ
jgi:hypothetical protein